MDRNGALANALRSPLLSLCARYSSYLHTLFYSLNHSSILLLFAINPCPKLSFPFLLAKSALQSTNLNAPPHVNVPFCHSPVPNPPYHQVPGTGEATQQGPRPCGSLSPEWRGQCVETKLARRPQSPRTAKLLRSHVQLSLPPFTSVER